MAFPSMEDQNGRTDPQVTSRDELHTAISAARLTIREEVAAEWELQRERMLQQLDNILADRFGKVEQALEARVTHEEEKLPAIRVDIVRDLTGRLNRIVRRLKQAEDQDVWAQTLLEAASEFCGKVALFRVGLRSIIFEGVRGADGDAIGRGQDIPIAAAPAFAEAIESSDTLVVTGTPRELSPAISGLLGDASDQKVYLFPILLENRTVAVLYAEASGRFLDVSALELLAAMAATSIGVVSSEVRWQPTDLVTITAAEPPRQPAKRPSWAELSRSDQEVHLRAQRFARTQVARLLLHNGNQLRAGRAQNNIYGALKEEIDGAREAFRREFMEACPSMVDYYHLELMRTLAKDDPDLLGSDYPGPLPS